LRNNGNTNRPTDSGVEAAYRRAVAQVHDQVAVAILATAISGAELDRIERGTQRWDPRPSTVDGSL
jgi:hypothetical protein